MKKLIQQNSTLLNENIKQVRTLNVDVTDNLQYEVDSQYHQLQLEMKNKDEDNQNKFKEIDNMFEEVECEKEELKKLQQQLINNNENDNCRKFEEFRIVSNGISSELISFKNCYEKEKSELNKGLNAAMTTIDDQSELIKWIKAATTDQSNKVNKQEDEIKDIKSRLGLVSILY
ncbi:hypothetical protein CHUAL_010512 [Chamberlinius hualienensis]